MTRYRCVHPAHAYSGGPASVDVTAQVRLEREFLPRESAYLADSGDVIRRVRELSDSDPVDRDAAVRRILTGTTSPLDAPIVLVAGDRVDRVPGLYEMDDLRRSERSVASLLDRYAQSNLAREGSEDVLVLRDEEPPMRPDGSIVEPGGAAPQTETVAVPQTRSGEARVLPQGVYPVLELAARLSQAEADDDAIVDVIHETRSFGAIAADRSRSPWRVIIECPIATGDPLTRHQVMFTGNGDPEPAEVLGTPAGGTDIVLEKAARRDVVPPYPAKKGERRLAIAMLTAAALGAVLLILSWISGGLALAARETPTWLGLSLILGVAALAIGLVALVSRTDAQGNENDTYALRRHYSSRVDMLWYSTIAMAVVFTLAVAAGVVPPILSSNAPIPAATITFAAGRQLVTATVDVRAQGVASDEAVTIQMRQYPSVDDPGVLVGSATTTGSTSGLTIVREVVSLDPEARYMSVLATIGDQQITTCSPAQPTGPGCVIVSVPPLGAGVVQFVEAVSILETIDEVAPTVSPAPSVVTPAPTVSPSITPSPSPI